MGNDRKTDRKTRKTLVLFFFLLDGGTREVDCNSDRACGGGGGGGGGAEESIAMMAVEVVFGSPMNRR